MKIALSVFKDSISTVFDAADHLIIFDTDCANRQKHAIIKLNTADVTGRAAQLKGKGIDVLICGAVSRSLEALISSQGIVVYPFVRGSVEEVIVAYQTGQLKTGTFAMPGCRGRGQTAAEMEKNKGGRRCRRYKDISG